MTTPLLPDADGSRSAGNQPTPPKSLEKIRATLRSIHEQSPTAAVGPLAEGLPPDDRLVIASFHDREVRRRFQDLLLARGIPSSWRRRDGQDQTLVDVSDRDRAASLLDEHLAAFPDRPQARARRVIDFVLLGAALGATISASFVMENSFARNRAHWEAVALSVVAFTVYGAIVGGLLAGVKERFRRQGRLQFTILDLLLLSALTALAALVWRLARADLLHGANADALAALAALFRRLGR